MARLSSGAAGRAVGRDRPIAAKSVLDEVRVVARRRHHHAHRPVARVERDDRAALRCRALECDLLAVEVERRDGRCRRRSACPCSLSSERSTSVERLRSTPVRKSFSDFSSPVRRASRRRVADDVRRQRALRVAAEVERASVHDAARCCRASSRAAGARIRPRRIWNCATRWIALSWRSASPARAQVCQ